MERLDALLNRLQELHENNASFKSLLVTATLIVAELQEKTASENNSPVSVFMPSINIQHLNLNSDVVTSEVLNKERIEKKAYKEESNTVYFDPLKEFPTLALKQKEMKELKESFRDNEEVLNDKLKIEQKEIATSISEMPIKDLRKAIGINDRFLFLNELFRGDETMYERSIKTINSFNILGEAEFWVSRELKTKLGWEDESETVKLFDQLIKRRFS